MHARRLSATLPVCLPVWNDVGQATDRPLACNIGRHAR